MRNISAQLIMEKNKIKDLQYGIESSESLVEILGIMRDSRNLIDAFSSEYAAYLGMENVRKLESIRMTIANGMKELNEIGDTVDENFRKLSEGSKRVPAYNMQLFRNEMICYRTDSHLFLRFPKESGYEGWNVRLSNRFVTVYDNGISEWRYYPRSTSVFLYKYTDEGYRESMKISGGRLAEILNRCNRLIQAETAKHESKICELAVKVDDCLFTLDNSLYQNTYPTREDGLRDTENCLRSDPDGMADMLYAIQDHDADLLADEICDVFHLTSENSNQKEI